MNKRLISNIVLIVLVIAIIIGITVIRTFVYPIKYKEQIVTYSTKNNLDPYLALAIINTESKFDENATSNKEAKGLMQITESTAKEINDMTNSIDEINNTTIYNIDVNLEIGCNYLASLITRYNGNYYIAICAYNAGIGNVNKWIEQGIISDKLDTTDVELPFKETTNYLKKVIKSYKMYKKIYPTLCE
jgi:soluble lytic murein transglycosylase